MDDDYLNDDDFNYSDDDMSGSEPDVDMENQYYSGKSAKGENDFAQAKECFEDVLNQEGDEKGEWGFKALKQLMKMAFAKKEYKAFLDYYGRLLGYVQRAVARNYSEKSITSIMDYVSTLKGEPEFVENFYSVTLKALKELKIERLWFKTNSKLGKLYFEKRDFEKLQEIIASLKASCRTESGEDDQKKGTQLMEVYALEIEMYTAQEDFQNLQRTYEKFKQITSAVAHPVIMGTIKECGGKMYLRNGYYERAFTDFFEAFKNYDEAGSQNRISALKYLVIASMLSKSDINPFDSQEAKPYKNNPAVRVLTDLIAAYQNNSVEQFQRVIADNPDAMGDSLIQGHLSALLANVRTQTVVKLVKPYTRIRTDYLAKRLNTSLDEVYRILRDTILEDGLFYRIDEINHMIELLDDQQEDPEEQSVIDAVADYTSASGHFFFNVMQSAQ
ncbi:hypothetical protein QR680_010496 [Steinernema hermaphroditum]|uniref:PCI domain-containing protein n=1 Tax=Steinernema hermaphroditum TaxID=289476 RepID=A0AA39MBV0_9BILA|nr:hypothetical protein QR680_010496 [Steinernema hermaphroditum]